MGPSVNFSQHSTPPCGLRLTYCAAAGLFVNIPCGRRTIRQLFLRPWDAPSTFVNFLCIHGTHVGHIPCKQYGFAAADLLPLHFSFLLQQALLDRNTTNTKVKYKNLSLCNMCVWCSWHLLPWRNNRHKQRREISVIFDVAFQFEVFRETNDMARLPVTQSNFSPHTFSKSRSIQSYIRKLTLFPHASDSAHCNSLSKRRIKKDAVKT